MVMLLAGGAHTEEWGWTFLNAGYPWAYRSYRWSQGNDRISAIPDIVAAEGLAAATMRSQSPLTQL